MIRGKSTLKTAIPIFDNRTGNEYKIDFHEKFTFTQFEKRERSFDKKKMGSGIRKYTHLHLEERHLKTILKKFKRSFFFCFNPFP